MLKSFKQYFSDESDRHILWLPVLFGLGIGFYFAWPYHVSMVWLVVLLEVVLFLMFWRRFDAGQMLILACVLTVLAGFSYMMLYTTYQGKRVQLIKEDETLYLTGRVARVEQTAQNKVRLWLDNVSDFEKSRQGIYRIVAANKTDIQAGACVETVASVMRPSAPLKPGGFMFDRQAFYQGIAAVGYAISTVYETDCAQTPGLMARARAFLNRIRKNITFEIAEILPKDEAAVASAVLVGDKNMLTPALYEAYRGAGLAHFLAISGLHIGLIAGLAFFAVRLVFALVPPLTLRYDSKIAGSIFAIAMSLIYLLLSGANVPAVRAFVMTTVVFVGLMMGREAISMRTVAFAAMVILLLEPYAILTAGFEMSFAAVVALVAFYEALQAQKKQSGKRFAGNIIYRYFLGVLLTTFVATLAVTPYTLYHFSSFSPYAILSNLLAAPLVAFVVMPLIFLSLLLLPLGWHVWPLKIAGFGFSGLNGLVREITTFPYADMVCRPLPLSGLILVTLGGLWLCLWTKKWRCLGIIPIVLGFLSYAFYYHPDVLYSADGLSVGIQKSSKELVIFSAKRKKFLFDAWAGDYQNVEVLSKAQSRPDIHVICDDKMCVWQDVFAFDLKGHLSLENVPLEPHKTEGGAVWLKNGKTKNVGTRSLRASKPWEIMPQ